jgi:hypothetical protein
MNIRISMLIFRINLMQENLMLDIKHLKMHFHLKEDRTLIHCFQGQKTSISIIRTIFLMK